MDRDIVMGIVKYREEQRNFCGNGRDSDAQSYSETDRDTDSIPKVTGAAGALGQWCSIVGSEPPGAFGDMCKESSRMKCSGKVRASAFSRPQSFNF